jgi:hypothetical protein
MWVRIDNGVVTEITDTDPTGKYYPSINWIDCIHANIGDAFVDGAFIPVVLDTVILSCSAWQIRAALTQLGWRAAVEAAISAANQDLQDAWHYANSFQQDNAKIAEIASAIGKTEIDVKHLFDLAVTLQV